MFLFFYDVINRQFFFFFRFYDAKIKFIKTQMENKINNKRRKEREGERGQKVL